ncbi:MAG: hypothetical protein IJC73_02295 [Lentisphaeria bacterium]|nr:hypothetical protein [Lentisphaeria bacterium]
MVRFINFMVVALVVMVIGGGCATRQKMPSEDLEVLTLYKDEIAILHSQLPTNSEAKYKAAKRLHDNVDFTYTRTVQTLDEIFSSVDAKVDNPNSNNQMLVFYYQYGDRSIRFIFHRYQNFVDRVEVVER